MPPFCDRVHINRGSVSVFQVGIGFSVYLSVFFQVVVGLSKYSAIGSIFSVFQFLRPRSRRWQKIALRTSTGLQGGSELSSLDESIPDELSP